mgnify:CR=1 FL=1
MKLTKQQIVTVINEMIDRYDIESKEFGDWLERIGALNDYPEFDKETWNKIGNLLTHDEESNRKQGREILDSFGFEDWDWLSDVVSSWDQASAAQNLKTHSLEPFDPMYDITYDTGDYDGGLSRMVSRGDAQKYLNKLITNLKPLMKKYKMRQPRGVYGWVTESDPVVYAMLPEPDVGWQIHHFGGASGPPRVYPIGFSDNNTSSEFVEWFMNNFDEAELTGNIEKDTKLMTDLIKSIVKFRSLNSHLKQMLFLKKPEMASKILGAKTAIGLE